MRAAHPRASPGPQVCSSSAPSVSWGGRSPENGPGTIPPRLFCSACIELCTVTRKSPERGYLGHRRASLLDFILPFCLESRLSALWEPYLEAERAHPSPSRRMMDASGTVSETGETACLRAQFLRCPEARPGLEGRKLSHFHRWEQRCDCWTGTSSVVPDIINITIKMQSFYSDLRFNGKLVLVFRFPSTLVS